MTCVQKCCQIKKDAERKAYLRKTEQMETNLEPAVLLACLVQVSCP